MENLYQEWTLEQDRELWENYSSLRPSSPSSSSSSSSSTLVVELASKLGRGLRGVEKRLSKLKDVNSPAYQRLFVTGSPSRTGPREQQPESESEDAAAAVTRRTTTKLIPVSEVIRRIRYDVSLPTDKFSILFYDRVENQIVETAIMAPNTSIQGRQTLLVDALPEHRIVAIKYLERVVWDRERRLDLVFAGPGIMSVMDQYNDWKQEQDATLQWNQQRQNEVSLRMQQAIGMQRFALFQDLVASLQAVSQDPTISLKLETEKFVLSALQLFQQARECPSPVVETHDSMYEYIVPWNETDALELLSELVALLFPDERLRVVVLTELSYRNVAPTIAQDKKTSILQKSMDMIAARPLPELDEKDLVESFVRGSGPGGQKINKTSNRVLLIHTPTQLRVECQDTRSLQQNRKIARKRLQLKLDEYWYGSQSRERVKAQQAAIKKNKAKARSRARQRRKQEATDTATTTTTATMDEANGMEL